MAGPGFDPSLTVGQLNLAGGVQCRTPWGSIGTGRLGSLAGVTHDREIAYTSLFARLVLKGQVKVTRADIRAAEKAIVKFRFGGSGGAYRSALGKAGATQEIARSVIGDELRQAKVQRHFGVAGPSGTQIAEYQQTYAATNARLVSASPAPSWLGRHPRGVAIEGMAPAAVFRVPTGRTVTLQTREGKMQVRAIGRRFRSARSRSTPRAPRFVRRSSGSPKGRSSTTGSCARSRARSPGRRAGATGCRRSGRSSSTANSRSLR